jgi:GH15 family glucan-1,4-alpha-glucosidase
LGAGSWKKPHSTGATGCATWRYRSNGKPKSFAPAITLKLNAYDDTGAIIAAMTTSIPEAAGSIRNWDYRFCWLRDSYFVVNVLNRLGATRTMERYIAYIINIAAGTAGGALQPVYGIDGRSAAARK